MVAVGLVDRGGEGEPGPTIAGLAIAAGLLHTCALLEDGTVRCWGSGYTGQLGYGQRTRPDPLNTFFDTRRAPAFAVSSG